MYYNTIIHAHMHITETHIQKMKIIALIFTTIHPQQKCMKGWAIISFPNSRSNRLHHGNSQCQIRVLFEIKSFRKQYPVTAFRSCL